MKTYETYRDSGIEWIGDIPEHWSKVSLKWVSEIYSGGTPSKNKPEYWSDGTIPWLNSGTVNQGDITEASEYITEEALANSSAKWFPEKAILIALAGQGKTKGMVAQTQFKATCNQSLGIIVPSYPELNRFLLYWLRKNYQNIRNLGGGNKRDGINLEMIGSIPVPLPTKEEQTAIANYLDKKTAAIDQLIADKKQLVALYQEEKTAIINQAVTKGINQNVKLKDSGIEWLGEIPEHWEVKRLKYVAQIVLGKMLTSIDKGNYKLKPYLRAANLNWLTVNVENIKEMWFSDKELVKYKIKRDDLLVSEGGEVGRTCIWKNELPECYLQNSVHKLTINDTSNPFYFLYQFLIKGTKGVFDYTTNRISIAHLTVEKLKEIKFITPPKEEQTEIVQHIEKESTRIDAKITKAEKYIKLLTEYRTALISEVVTGKIKVIE